MTLNDRNAARIAGVLLLIGMTTWTIGYTLIDSLLALPDYLLHVQANYPRILAGVFAELVGVGVVVGIAVVLFPILRRQHERLALGYVVVRIIEAILLVVVALSALLMITLSQDYLSAGTADVAYFETLGALLLALRSQWTHGLLIPAFYILGALALFSMFYQTRLIPRWLAAVGVIGAVMVVAGTILSLFALDVGLIFGLPMGLIELFLGVWLIVKGFSDPQVDPHRRRETSLQASAE